MRKFLSLVLVLIAGAAFAQGSIQERREPNTPPQRIVFSWTASTAGVVNVESQPIRGTLNRAVIYHGTNDVPTGVTYVVTIKDSNGIDLLAAQGAAVASNVVTQCLFGTLVVDSASVTSLYTGPVVNEKLTIGVTGVGDSKKGTIVIYGD